MKDDELRIKLISVYWEGKNVGMMSSSPAAYRLCEFVQKQILKAQLEGIVQAYHAIYQDVNENAKELLDRRVKELTSSLSQLEKEK